MNESFCILYSIILRDFLKHKTSRMRTVLNTQSKGKVVTSEQLQPKDIMDLIEGRIIALRIPFFVAEATCKAWRLPLENSTELSRYSNAHDVSVNRIGMTLFETEHQREKLEQYFESASHTYPTIENILHGDNPIREIHNAFNQAWDNGCQIENLHGHKMNPGIIRSFEADPEGGLPPHMDTLFKDIPEVRGTKNITSQLATNLYISTSEEGGELEIWDFSPTIEELEMMYCGVHDFIDRDNIPIKPVVIKPEVGELIIFRSHCIHSVRPSRGGMRTAASCFIGYYDEQQPLTAWA